MNESKATRYQRWRRRARIADQASSALMLGLIAFTPLSTWLSRVAYGSADGLTGATEQAVAFLVFVTIVVVLCEGAALPAAIYFSRTADGRDSSAAPSVEDVVGAHVRATGLTLVAAVVGGGMVLVAASIAGAFWWLVAGLLVAAALSAALHLTPALLASLADVRPLSRQPLVDALVELARRANTPIAGIAEWRVADAAPTTALVAGVGRGRRILLSSSLTRHWSDEEISVVVAHELAHHAHGDLWRTLALDCAVLSMALAAADLTVRTSSMVLGGAGPGDLAALPLIAFVATLVWAFSTPIRHAQSRRQERRADLFALELTDGADAFRTAIRRLGDRWLAEERPTRLTRWLYHRHPPVAERLALAEAFRQASHVRRGEPSR